VSTVVVTATFTVKDDRMDDALAAITETIEATHDEPGCQSYALHRDVNAPNTLVLVERWTSQVALDAHLQQPYVAKLGAAAAELLAAPPVIHFCEPVPVGDPMKGSL
jgi:quinol monooxygenase YgiN